ncbi:MAG: cytochrome b [Parvularculaceae bacterium]
MTKNISPERYDLVAQCLHWAMAMILIYLVFSSSFEDVQDMVMEQRIQLHSGLGLTVLGLGLVRWIWRFARPRPAPISVDARWQKIAADIIHHAFYGLFLLAPLLGLILATLVSYPVQPYGLGPLFRWPEDSPMVAGFVNSLHGFAADVILVLLVIHTAAALYHQFVRRDAIIARMLPRI